MTQGNIKHQVHRRNLISHENGDYGQFQDEEGIKEQQCQHTPGIKEGAVCGWKMEAHRGNVTVCYIFTCV